MQEQSVTTQTMEHRPSILSDALYQRFQTPEEAACFGRFETSQGNLPLKRLELRGQIVGLIYRLQLKQVFCNSHSSPVEAIYTFPLPSRAAVTRFVTTSPRGRIEGQLQERGQARRQYQEAIARGQQASLAEQERAEIFTMTVGNLEAQESIEVELELEGPLAWADQQAMFRFPLVVAPRYIPGVAFGGNVGSGTADDTDRVGDASRISPPRLLSGYPNPVELSIDIDIDDCGMALPQPQVSLVGLTAARTEKGWHLSLLPTADRIDRDLIVRFDRHNQEFLHFARQYRHQETNEYFQMLTLLSPKVEQASRARQVVVLLDQSGSMQGWKMLCARQAVGRLVDCLGDQDQFCVLKFESSVHPLLKMQMQWGNDDNRHKARQALQSVEASGGTEMLAAFRAAYQLLDGCQEGYLIVVTDGEVGNESELRQLVSGQGTKIRLFTVGIDRAVNFALLEELSQKGGGTFTLVDREEQLVAGITSLSHRLAPPLLRELRWRADAQHPWSEPVGELHSESFLRILLRNTLAWPATVELSALDFQGSPWFAKVPVDLASETDISRLWARQEVARLEYAYDKSEQSNERQALKNQQIQTSLQYGVLSRFTAFVAVDLNSQVRGPLTQVVQPVSQVSGWSSPGGGARAGLMRRAACSTPPPDPFAAPCDAFAAPCDAFVAPSDPFAAPCDAFAAPSDPFAASNDPFGSAADPFIGSCDPFGPGDTFAANDPFATNGTQDPFAAIPEPLEHLGLEAPTAATALVDPGPATARPITPVIGQAVGGADSSKPYRGLGAHLELGLLEQWGALLNDLADCCLLPPNLQGRVKVSNLILRLVLLLGELDKLHGLLSLAQRQALLGRLKALELAIVQPNSWAPIAAQIVDVSLQVQVSWAQRQLQGLSPQIATVPERPSDFWC